MMGKDDLGEKLKILAIDDEPDFLSLLEIMLRAGHHQVRLARDGVEALEVLSGWTADVLLVDLQMPRMGGRDLLREVRLRHPESAAVVLTAYGDEEVATEVLRELGAADYLPKTSLTAERLGQVLFRADLVRRATAVERSGAFDVFTLDHRQVAQLFPLGELLADRTFERIGRFEEALAVPLKRGKRSALVDLSFLRAIVPLALRSAVLARRRYREAGGDLWLASPGREIAEVVAMFDESRSPDRLGLRVVTNARAALEALDR